MKLKNIKTSQCCPKALGLKGDSTRFGRQLLKPLLYAGGTLLLAFSSSSVHAEELFSISDHANQTGFAPGASFELDSANQHPVFTGTSRVGLDQLNDSPLRRSFSATKESNHPGVTLNAASLVGDRPLESRSTGIESTFQLNSIAQVDIPPPEFTESALRDRWQFSVTPYFFVPFNVRTNATVRGRSASFRLGLGDILNLDRALDAGVRLEAWRDRWGFIFDGFYLSAKDSGTLGVTFPAGSLQRFGINFPVRTIAGASLAVRQGTIDLAAAYRAVDTPLNNSAGATNPFPRLVVAPFLGLRTNILSQKLEVDNVAVGIVPLGFIGLPVNQDFSFSRTFVEPLLGAQIGLNLSSRWAVGIRGDVSGFNINARQNLTWNLLAGVRYNFSPSTSVQLGYRFNSFDFEDGSGSRRAKVNLRQNGLLLSVVFRF